ncbi:MAG: hypothetical protein AABY26_01945, partial [Nanoarchaeota archaeon]
MNILDKVKEKLKKIISAKFTLKPKKKTLPLQGPGGSLAKEIPGFQETIAVNTKFSYPESARARSSIRQDIPYQYDQDKIVLQVRDPHW